MGLTFIPKRAFRRQTWGMSGASKSKSDGVTEKTPCLVCGKLLRMGRTHCPVCRKKPIKCPGCKKTFYAKSRGKFPDLCDPCLIEIRKENSREYMKEKRLKKTVEDHCKMCGVLLAKGKTTKYKYCQNCYPIFRAEWEKQRAIRRLKEDPQYIKRQHLKSKFGLALNEFEEMFSAQEKRCAICHSDVSRGQGWHVDHDHQDGRIRGILCHFCNLAIGHFRDDVPNLTKAINYLLIWKEVNG